MLAKKKPMLEGVFLGVSVGWILGLCCCMRVVSDKQFCASRMGTQEYASQSIIIASKNDLITIILTAKKALF